MCIIAVKQNGANLPKDVYLKECETRNKDGIGIVFWKTGSSELTIKKDFKDANELIKWSKDNIKKEDACIFHFRFATHGLVDEGNRHPFPITKNKELLRKTNLVCQMAVAHNGVIGGYNHNKFSDTQKFVLDILAEDTIKNNLEIPAVQKLISNFISGDRLAIMNNDGSILLFGDWKKEEDILYSNDGYKPVVYNYIGFEKNWKEQLEKYNYGKKNQNDTVWKGVCEGCDEERYVKFVEHPSYDGFVLCKACRKKYRKGTLKIEDFEIKPPKMEDIEKDDMDNKENEEKTEFRCESCLEWVTIEEMTRYFGAKLCNKCVDWVGLDGKPRINL